MTEVIQLVDFFTCPFGVDGMEVVGGIGGVCDKGVGVTGCTILLPAPKR